jgi:predicted RNase H-like HicB family nuclease
MQIPILIEPIAGNGYRARGGEPLALSAEGATREEALAKLQEQLQARLRNGAEIVPLESGPQAHPLAKFVGMFKDDPRIDDWKKSMAQYRRKIDRHPKLP